MADIHHYLTRTSHDKLKRLVDLHLNRPPVQHAPLEGLISDGESQIVRLGKIYGGVLAAVYDGSGTLTQAKKCEVLLHRIRADGSQMEDFETEPEVAYSIVTSDLADGAEVVCLRDRTINDPDHPEVAQPGWVVLAAAGGGSPFLHEPCELCMSTPHTVTTDALQTLKFTSAKNLNTDYYTVLDSGGAPLTEPDTIVLLKQGWYELGYSIEWKGPITSPGGSGITSSYGTVALYANATPIPCTGVEHAVWHDEATGASKGGETARQILYRRGATSVDVRLYTQNGSASHNREFSGVMWANYLGHDKEPVTTVGDGS